MLSAAVAIGGLTLLGGNAANAATRTGAGMAPAVQPAGPAPLKSLDTLHGGRVGLSFIKATPKIIKEHKEVFGSKTPHRRITFVHPKTNRLTLAVGCIGVTNQVQFLDLSTGKLLGTVNVGSHNAGVKEMIYSERGKCIVALQGDMVHKIDVNTYKSTEAAKAGREGKQCYSPAADSYGRIWFGTYPDAAPTRFDPRDNSVFYSKKAQSTASYVRALDVYGDDIYVGTGSVHPRLGIYKVSDPLSPKRIIAPPNVASEGFVLRIQALAADSVFVHYEDKSLKAVASLYRPSLDKWIQLPFIPRGRNIEAVDGDAYAYLNHDKKFKRIRLDDATVDQEFDFGHHVSEFSVRASGSRRIADAYYSVGDKHYYAEVDLGAQKVLRTVELQIAYSGFNIQSTFASSDGNVYVGGYQGDGFGVLNPDTGAKSRSVKGASGGQVESFVDIDKSTIAYGSYGSAKVYTAQRGSLDATALVTLRDVNQQSRPFGLTYAAGLIIVGTVAEYGLANGALSVLYPDGRLKREMTGYIPGQSIVALASEGDIVYGGSSTRVGYGAPNAKGDAYIFAYDARNHKTLWKRPLPGEVEINTPVVVGDTVYFSLPNGVVAVNKSNGLPRHSYLLFTRDNRAGYTTSKLAYSPKHKVLVHQGGGTVTVIDPARKTRWEIFRGAYKDITIQPGTGRAFLAKDATNIIEFDLTPEKVVSPTITGKESVVTSGGKYVYVRNVESRKLQAAQRVINTGSTVLSVFNIDWFQRGIQDVVTVQKNGYMYVWRAKESGGFEKAKLIGSGWSTMNVAMQPASNGVPVVIGASRRSGEIFRYRVVNGRFSGRIKLSGPHRLWRSAIYALVNDASELIAVDGGKAYSYYVRRNNTEGTYLKNRGVVKTSGLSSVQSLTGIDGIYSEGLSGIFYKEYKGAGAKYISYRDGKLAGIVNYEIGTGSRLQNTR